MKTMKKSLAILMLSVAALQMPVMADNKPVEVKQLPKAAQMLLKKDFAKYTIVTATTERELLNKKFEVHFNNGGSIEFDHKGNWTEIDCGKQSVPSHFIPAAIVNHVKKTWAGATITKIEKDRSHYDIKLSNGTEVTYDANFKVVDIDN